MKLIAWIVVVGMAGAALVILKATGRGLVKSGAATIERTPISRQ
jgi:hypothetical protein